MTTMFLRTSALVGGAAAGWVAERLLMRRIDQVASPSLETMLPADSIDRIMPTPDGGSTHWIEAGAGRPLILLHGISLEAEAWASQFELSDRVRVISVDLRGHGRSVTGTDGATITTNAADLAVLLERENLRGAVLVGHSMGGMVVAHFLATAEANTLSRVSGVAFVDSALRSPVRKPIRHDRLDALLQRPAVAARMGTVPNNDAGRLAVMATFGRQPSTLALQTVAESFDRLEPETYWQSMPSILEHDVRAGLGDRTDLERITVKVIVGERDRLTPLRCANEIVAAFPGSELHVLAGIGHQSMMEAPAEVNRLLLDLIHESA